MKNGWTEWDGKKPKVKLDTYMVIDKNNLLEAMSYYDKEKWEAFGVVAYAPVAIFPTLA